LKRNLLLVNLALLVLVCFLGWYLRKKWMESHEHERKVLSVAVKPVPIAPPPPLKKVAPIDGAAYAVVVDRYLFSADRNPTPPPEPPPVPPPPKQMPPLPVAHGVMLWDGVPPTVVLSERGQQGQRAYHPGDRIGQFAVVSVNNKEVVFDWDGKEVSARLDDMMEKGLMNPPPGPGPGVGPAPSAPPPPAPPTVIESAKGPGAEIPGQGISACIAGDNTPPGTVVNGLQKKVNTTPFGVTCRWEPVK
jgi:hypothetical protein